MKVSKALYGIDIVLAAAKATSASSHNNNKSPPTTRELENVFARCALPCSFGRCNLWDDGNDAWDLDTVHYRSQDFYFRLETSNTYTIKVIGDEDQCTLDPTIHLYDSDDNSAASPCFPSKCQTVTPAECDLLNRGFPREAVIESFVPASSGLYKLEVSNGSGELCPSEGFKYTVEIDPLPEFTEGSSIDPTCNDPPHLPALVRGGGIFPSPSGAEDALHHLEPGFLDGKPVSITFPSKIESGSTEGDVVFDFPAANLKFESETLEYFFINDKFNCARLKAWGKVTLGDQEYEDRMSLSIWDNKGTGLGDGVQVDIGGLTYAVVDDGNFANLTEGNFRIVYESQEDERSICEIPCDELRSKKRCVKALCEWDAAEEICREECAEDMCRHPTTGECESVVECIINPCSVGSPCEAGQLCDANYCGGCHAVCTSSHVYTQVGKDYLEMSPVKKQPKSGSAAPVKNVSIIWAFLSVLMMWKWN